MITGFFDANKIILNEDRYCTKCGKKLVPQVESYGHFDSRTGYKSFSVYQVCPELIGRSWYKALLNVIFTLSDHDQSHVGSLLVDEDGKGITNGYYNFKLKND